MWRWCPCNHPANQRGMFAITRQGPLINIVSLITDDYKHLYYWREDAPKIGLLVFKVWNGGHPGDLVPKAAGIMRAQAIKQTHLVPASMTTLACLIPLGMRSLMTSRMIRDPMKEYSAARKCPYWWQGANMVNNKSSLCFKKRCIYQETHLHLCSCLSLYLFLVLFLERGLELGLCHSIRRWNSMGWICPMRHIYICYVKN